MKAVGFLLQVYAVEASSMAQHTEELVRQNGCEGVVRVFQERAENLTLPGKVDVLVSEWMGNCLLVWKDSTHPQNQDMTEASKYSFYSTSLIYFDHFLWQFEFMVESVLLARDRWLEEGGMMWPSSACLSVVPCQAFSDYRQKMEFWEQPYGLDFSYFQWDI